MPKCSFHCIIIYSKSIIMHVIHIDCIWTLIWLAYWQSTSWSLSAIMFGQTWHQFVESTKIRQGNLIMHIFGDRYKPSKILQTTHTLMRKWEQSCKSKKHESKSSIINHQEINYLNQCNLCLVCERQHIVKCQSLRQNLPSLSFNQSRTQCQYI